MQQLSKGTTLQGGKYIIERVLGQGGFGITYLATHSFLEKQVAIKEFFPKDFCERNGATSHITLGNANTTELVVKLKEKFLKEAKNISKLNHPNIVAIHDIFEENGTAYYLMDFIDGTSLNDKIKSVGALPEEMAVKYIRIVGNAISYMHSKKMNHLDIKPANIMLRKSDDAPILIDFGLAKQYDSTGEQTSTTPVGISHGYAPIEQYRPGGVSTFTPQSDVYALGATLFALLTGQTPPHYSDILEDGLPELPTSVSQQTVDAIEHAMEIKKNKRPTTVQELLYELAPNNYSNGELSIRPDVVKNITDSKSKKDNLKNITIESICKEETILIHDPNFIDLGLSVQWGIDNEGVYMLHGDRMQFKLKNNDSFLDYDAIRQTHFLPSLSDWLELIDKCKWMLTLNWKYPSYRVEGPNGKAIYLPISDSYLYLTSDSFNSSEKSQYMFCGENQYGLIKKSYVLNSFVRFIKSN